MSTSRAGIIGLGTVGMNVAQILCERSSLFRRKYDIAVEPAVFCDTRKVSLRALKTKQKRLAKDAFAVVNDPNIDIIVELIGGIHPAKELISQALRAGKDVVTANKALLAEEGKDLFALAQRCGRQLRFEAAVGGGIPVLKSLREGFSANKIETVYGIVNGTANYILSKMEDASVPFKNALTEAQQRGFAERNPSLDIDGGDSAHKLALLVLLGYDITIPLKNIYVEGIRHITLNDVQYADELGCVIKLLAIAKRDAGKLDVRVHPTLLPKEHLLSSVRKQFNAIYIKGDLIGESLFYGQGAGGPATASAVVSDILDCAQATQPDLRWDLGSITASKKTLPLKKVTEVTSRYYLRVQMLDKPNVLARIARILGAHGISISSVLQKERRHARSVPVVMTTHEACERDLQRALKAIDNLDVVRQKTMAIHMEDS